MGMARRVALLLIFLSLALSPAFAAYPGTGLSAWKEDFNGDGTNDYIIENERIKVVYNGVENNNVPLLYLYNKGAAAGLTFGTFKDTYWNVTKGRGEVSSDVSNVWKFSGMAFNTTGDSLAAVKLSLRGYVKMKTQEVVTTAYHNGGGGRIQVYANVSGTIKNTLNLSTTSSATVAMAGDYDGDGNDEIIATNQSQQDIWVLANVSGGYSTIWSNLTVGYGSSTYQGQGEATGDGKMDFIPSGHLWQNMSGGYQETYYLANWVITAGDADNDGWPDLFYGRTRPNGGLHVYKNSSGVWSFAYNASDTNIQGDEAQACDMDGSGNNTIVNAGLGSASRDAATAYKYNGSATLQKLWENLSMSGCSAACYAQSLVCGDVDGDGLDEAVFGASAYTNGGRTHVFKQNVTNASHFYEPYPRIDDACGGLQGAMSLGDVDNDGVLEVLCPRGSTTAQGRIYKFSPATNSFVNLSASTNFFHTATTANFNAKASVADIDTSNDRELFVDINITVNSNNADFLVYNVSGLNKVSTNMNFSSFFVPLGGQIGSAISDDKYYIGNGTWGSFDDRAIRKWTDFPTLSALQSFIAIYDNSTSGDSNYSLTLGIVRSGNSSSATMSSLSVRNETVGIRGTKYQYGGAKITFAAGGPADWARFYIVVANCSDGWKCINDSMYTVTGGSDPTAFGTYGGGGGGTPEDAVISASMSSPSSDPNIYVNQTFYMNCTGITGGAATGLNLSFMYNKTGTAAFANIPTSGTSDLVMAVGSNPQTNAANNTSYNTTIMGKTATSYYVKCRLYNSSAEVNSSLQLVTVSSGTYIDITTFGSVAFGNVAPGTYASPAQLNTAYGYNITINPNTNCWTNISIKGDPYFNWTTAPYNSKWFLISNLSYNNATSGVAAANMSGSYPATIPFADWQNIPVPGLNAVNRSLNFWVSTPNAQYPAGYNTTITINVTKYP